MGQLISPHFELDFPFERFDSPRGDGDLDRVRGAWAAGAVQDVAEDSHLDGIAGVGVKVLTAEPGPLLDEGPLLVVRVGEADLDQAGLEFVIDPSDRFTT